MGLLLSCVYIIVITRLDLKTNLSKNDDLKTNLSKEIFRFDLHGQTLTFYRKSLAVKFHVKNLFTT